ncbi:MAG: hypothetical protein AAF511_09550 [Pseudomonadota bacterium]
MKKALIGSLAAIATTFGAAQAASILDFTADILSPVAGKSRTATEDGVLFTITGKPQAVNNSQRFDGGTQDFCQSEGGDLACLRDGLGIKDDELTATPRPDNERATITSEAINVNRLFLLDLFKSNDPKLGAEQARIDLYTADDPTTAAMTIRVTADETKSENNAGYYAVDVGLKGVVKIVFRANQRSGTDDKNSDFSVAAVEFSEMPVPGAAIFFGSALLAGAAARRKRAA